MSLTSVVKSAAVKKLFAEAFRYPKLEGEAPGLLAPSIGTHPQLVGIAYDYAFRIGLQNYLFQSIGMEDERNIKISSPFQDLEVIHEDQKGVKPIRVISGLWVCDIVKHQLKIVAGVKSDIAQASKQIIKDLRMYRFEALEDPDILAQTDKLVTLCLKLAKLDLAYRAGYVSEHLEAVDEKDAEDVRAIYQKTDFSKFKVSSYCLLNPQMKAAILVRGADPDIVLDGCLIDIKTTTNLVLTPEMLNQLFGYLVLSRMSRFKGFEGVGGVGEITQLGIYFARYDYLYKFNVADVIDDKALSLVVRTLKKDSLAALKSVAKDL